MSRLGIIAGGGALPRKLIDACRRDQRPFFVLGFKGQTDHATLAGTDHAWSKLGATNEAISILKSNEVDTLVMAGNIRRPSLGEMRPDIRTMQVFARLGLKALGDDRLLKAVTGELEKDGFTVIGAHEVEPALITPEGVLGKVLMSNEARLDVEFGIIVTKTLGRLDVGQAAVIQEGVAIGIEAVEGTDALLERCRKVKRKGRPGVLVKSCKPQQDKRLDLPAIGLRTVRRAFEAGLQGIAVEAGASLLLDREEVVESANKLGLFILGFRA
ncbi:MAG TPA: UDP-2,3-diacylglucosamine diphosphatase LpxI [Patescibacteria group bacterium]|nr:UDP-2,3-diacylglucosamine diphosphatase LpxI [Patescibacteria group bacterium]